MKKAIILLFVLSTHLYLTAQNCGSQLAIGAHSTMTSEIEVFLGSDLDLTAPAISGSNTYQWYKRDINNNLQPIAGATSYNFTITNISIAELGMYNCSVDGQFDAMDLVVKAFNNSYADRLADSLALVDFFHSTDGLNWSNQTNKWLNGPINTWHGVTVSNCRVTRIDLYNNGLNGTIPPSFQNLTELRHLHLRANNSLTGDLSIQGFEKLGYLGASSCSFNSFTVNTSNSFYGSLATIDLSYNSFNGSQLDISTMPFLKSLTAENAGFGGNLVVNTSYEYYPRMERINIYHNQFTGALDITNMPNIQQITAHYNSFTSVAKSNVANYYSDLTYLQLSNNDFSSYPVDLSNMPSLVILSVEQANVNSIIWNTAPNYYQNLKNISFYINNLSGEFDIREFPALEELRLAFNNIEKLKTGSATHHNLRILALWQNDFKGNHLNVQNMPKLTLLGAGYSNIAKVHFSTTPNFYQDLATINLETNPLTGTYSFENMPSLSKVELYNNHIDLVQFNSQPSYYTNLGSINGEFASNSLDFFSFEGNMGLFDMNTSTFSPQEKIGISYTNTGGTRTLTVNHPGTPGLLTFTWFRDGNAISPAVNSNVLDITSLPYGSYHCKVTNSSVSPLTLESGSFNFTSQTQIAPPQNNGPAIQNQSVFPNPIKVGQKLTLKPSFNLTKTASLTVTVSSVNNSNNMVQFNGNMITVGNNNSVEFVLKGVTAGYHIVKLTDGKGNSFSQTILVTN